MALIVQKYGGSSVRDLDRVFAVAQNVVNTKRAGNDVVVVLSAMGGETDSLLRLAKQIDSRPDERELDALLATGEQKSCALMAIAINKLGERAVSLAGLQTGVFTEGQHQRARIRSVYADHISRLLKDNYLPVVAGFQGVNRDMELTTIGRGGSDTTAIAVAAALRADWCEVYTDVEGIFTADPKVCPAARKIERLSYDEMLEIAGAGAKVLEARSVQLAAKYQVPIHVRSSFSGADGTWITSSKDDVEAALISAIALTENEAKVAVRQLPEGVDVPARLFSPIAKAGINVDMIIQNVSRRGFIDITFTCSKYDLNKAIQIAEGAAKLIGAEKIEAAGDIAKVSIIGVGMKSHAGVASLIFAALAREEIAIQMISTSEIKVSIIVDDKQVRKAVNVLHEVFNLTH